jgi:hypothetical protein
VLFDMRDVLLHVSETQLQIYGVSLCVPAFIIIFFLAYILIKGWVKRLK